MDSSCGFLIRLYKFRFSFKLSNEDAMNGFDIRSSHESFAAVEEYGGEGVGAVRELASTFPTAYFEHNDAAVDSWRYVYVKRILDAVIASAMLLVLALPGLLIAAVILATSSGPVFYREKRIGRFGRTFQIWKFRSMRCNPSRSRMDRESAKDHLSYRTRKTHGDPRITSVGRFLRRWSLDEIPQIINVLRGEMSMIGPRPIVETEACFYGDLLPFYLAATPGLSGLWQVSGRSNIDYPKRAALDASYVMDWSLRTDLDIFLQTIPAVLKKTGAC